MSQDTDTNYLRSLYARAINMDESGLDSIRYYAREIEAACKNINFPIGKIYSLRLTGYYYENKGDYEKAVDLYLQTLDSARKLNIIECEVAALTDLAAVYTSNLKQPQKAKEFYLECVQLNKQRGDQNSLFATYTNLGAIYNKLSESDSALYFLNEGLKMEKSLLASGEDLSPLYNNLGNTYFSKKEFNQSLYWFDKNFQNHIRGKEWGDLWLDELNLADTYIEKGIYDSAGKYAHSSFDIATQLHSDSKKADSYSILAKLYQRQGDYRKAYENLQNWYRLDTAQVNSETYRVIAGLQQKFDARERENENLLLQAEVAKQKFDNRMSLILVIGLLITVSLIGIAFEIKRKANERLQDTNDLVIRQNEKLSELNDEKNSLISIVSHDLGTPFASIGNWTQLLEDGDQPLDESQQKAVTKIREITSFGERMIRNILNIEKEQISQHKLKIEKVDLKDCIDRVVEDFQQEAARKNISIIKETGNEMINLMSDYQLLTRIFSNLLSNAIKYTSPGKKVWVRIAGEPDQLIIQFIDEGVGVSAEELPSIFSKYAKISSRPTADENSTGLGLSIVKRLVEELNGNIRCESEKDKGSVFTVSFVR